MRATEAGSGDTIVTLEAQLCNEEPTGKLVNNLRKAGAETGSEENVDSSAYNLGDSQLSNLAFLVLRSVLDNILVSSFG